MIQQMLRKTATTFVRMCCVLCECDREFVSFVVERKKCEDFKRNRCDEMKNSQEAHSNNKLNKENSFSKWKMRLRDMKAMHTECTCFPHLSLSRSPRRIGNNET